MFFHQGPIEEARANLELARDISLETDEFEYAAQCMWALGEVYCEEDLLDAASDQVRNALDIYTKASNPLGIATAHFGIAQVLLKRGEYSAAEIEFATAQAQLERLGSWNGVGCCLEKLGDLHRQQGRYDDALRNLETARETFTVHTDHSGLADVAYTLGLVYRDQSQHTEALAQLRVARQQYLELELHRYVEKCNNAIEQLVGHS